MPKYLSTVYKDSNKIVVDSTTNIRPNLQSTKSLAPPPRKPRAGFLKNALWKGRLNIVYLRMLYKMPHV